MSNKQTVVIRGKTSFAKLLGDPILNYDKSAKEWKTDIEISKATEKELKGYGIADRIKTKDTYLDGAPYLTFKQPEFRKDGKPNRPIRIVDIKGNPWDENKLIGNGTTVDVKFEIWDFGPGKKKGVYIRSVRVLDHKAYERKEFDDIPEDDEFYEAAKAAEEKLRFDGEQNARELARLRHEVGMEDSSVEDDEVI